MFHFLPTDNKCIFNEHIRNFLAFDLLKHLQQLLYELELRADFTVRLMIDATLVNEPFFSKLENDFNKKDPSLDQCPVHIPSNSFMGGLKVLYLEVKFDLGGQFKSTFPRGRKKFAKKQTKINKGRGLPHTNVCFLK